MKRNLIVILIAIILPLSAFSQIGDEIASYVDSTEILVHKGRKLILKELTDSNLIKTKEIYDYLTKETKEEPYSAFYYLEDLYINMLVGDWETVNNLMLEHEKYKNKIVYPNSQEIASKLYELTLSNKQAILSSCNMSQIDEQAKMLIAGLLKYIEKESSDKEYNEILIAYKKKYDNQNYESFVKGFMPKKIIKASWNFSFGTGMVFTTDDLATNFSNNASYNMGMDFNIHKVFTSLYLHGTSLKLQEPFVATSDIDTLNFELNEKFTYLDAGLKVGYFIVRSNRFHLAPYASISGSFLESTKYDDSDDNDLEYEIFNSFTYGIGLHTEVKIYDFERKNMYYGGTTNGYFSIKFETGYNKILKFKDTYAIGDTPYLICALVLGFGQF
ncbi:MAG: hypothetical protein R6W78_10970 [Bacteroidales bacterium]